MIFRINHYIERGADELGVQIEAEYNRDNEGDISLIEVTHNGKIIIPTKLEEVGIMRALWADIEERESE